MYEQIYQYIKDEIRKGNIRPEKQLPSSRDLAKSLKVSRSTTQLAYEHLHLPAPQSAQAEQLSF